jgi:molecular chaperone HtpG
MEDGDLQHGALLDAELREGRALSEDEARLLANFLKETLGDRVGEVRASKRLVGSPAVVVDKDSHMTTSMRRVMKAMQQREGGSAMSFEAKPDLEINPDHAILARLEKLRHEDSTLAGQITEQVFDNALVAAGLLEDPRMMLARLNGLLEKLLTK